MPHWIVTYASMPIEADTAAEAVERDGRGGGHWQTYPTAPGDPERFDLEVDVTHGDADLPVLEARIGPAKVAAYQYRDEDDGPLPVLVVEVETSDPDLEVRVYHPHTPQTTT